MRVGGWELNGGGYEVRQAVMAALPSAYRPATGLFDVALLLLDKPSTSRPVRLHPASPNPKHTWAQGVPLSALGWGTLWWGGPQPRYLHEVRCPR